MVVPPLKTIPYIIFFFGRADDTVTIFSRVSISWNVKLTKKDRRSTKLGIPKKIVWLNEELIEMRMHIKLT